MKKLILTLLIGVLFIVVFQTIDKSGAIYIPIIWVIVNILPALYLVLSKAARHNMIYILGYTLLTLITVLSANFVLTSFGIGSDKYLLISFTWLLFGQIGIWSQYYFTRPIATEDTLSFRMQISPEKSEYIRKLISTGKIKKAVEELNTGEELSQEQKVIVTNFAYQYSKLVNQEAMGLMTKEEAKVEKNRIVAGILRFI